MAFRRPTINELTYRVQEDLRARLQLAGVGLRRSVLGVIARVFAGVAHSIHGYLEYLSRQQFPDTSEGAYLERHASLYGITRRAAAFASGEITVIGTTGIVIPEDTRLRRADGVEFATTVEATLASGTAVLEVEAVLAGVAGNTDAGGALTFVSPIAGVTAVGSVTIELSAGSDVESDDDLRDRVLARMRQPPHGGTASDYVMWAKEVPGVTRVWVYPLELGPGTVTVRFMRDGDVDPIPDAGEVSDVFAHIYERRPVTAAVTVLAPVAVPLNFTISITPDTSELRDAVEAELGDLLARTAVPGGTILKSQMDVAVGTTAGITNFAVTTPAADVTHTTGQIAVMGSITWT